MFPTSKSEWFKLPAALLLLCFAVFAEDDPAPPEAPTGTEVEPASPEVPTDAEGTDAKRKKALEEMLKGAKTISASPTIRGRILTMDKQLKAVVLNVGETNGVKKQMLFRAYRKDTFIGHLRVRHVFPDMAIATIEGESQPFKAGDDVTTRLLEADTSKNAPEMTEIKPDPSKHQMPSKKKGKILSVDRRVPGKVLVAFNLGSVHGLVRGQRMTVSRGSNWVATVEVKTVHENLSIGTVGYHKLQVVSNDDIYPRTRLPDKKPPKPPSP